MTTKEPTFSAPDLDEESEEQPELFFSNVEEFVTKHLIPSYNRSIDGNTRFWCPQWWRHPEAVQRLEAIWRAWEHLRQDPSTGMSVWWRDHADYHLRVLMAGDGPFRACSVDEGHKDRTRKAAFPVEPAPRGLFDPQ
ncbi:DUF4913 domain-containing protein [Kocuria massiliensis]|uniref:DUF4913 domain-containing protein n=1 Tax=Kocuria massiliensis TaxID=1926282 RepID=UPI000A1CA580|nr:DUF4913 domain-containing protein [Kocuria massiliensis]